MTLGELQVLLGVDASGLKAGEKAVQNFTATAEHEINKLHAKLRDQAKAFEDVGKKLSIAITAPLVALAGFGIKQAKEAEDAMRKFSSAFGASSERMARALEQFRTVDDDDLKGMVASIQVLQRAMGLAVGPAEEMSLGLTKIADAIDKVRGGGMLNILDALRAGLAGQTRGLVEFGIKVDELSIKQEAFRLGILKQGQTLTTAGQAIAVYSLIQRQTVNVQTEAAQAAESSGRQLAAYVVQLKNAAEELGRRLLPAFISLVRAAADVAAWFQRLDPGLQSVAITFGVMVAAVGPLILGFFAMGRAIGAVIQSVQFLSTALLALNLSPAGAIITGLGLLATTFFLIKSRIDEAMPSLKEFRASLQGIGEQSLKLKGLELISGIIGAENRIASAKQTIAAVTAQLPGSAADNSARLRGLRDAQTALRDATADLKRFTEQNIVVREELKKLGNSADNTGGALSVLTAQLTDLDALGQRVDLIARAFDLIEDKAQTPVEIWQALPKVIAEVNQQLEKQTDFLSADAIHLREMKASLLDIAHTALSASLLPKIGITPGTGSSSLSPEIIKPIVDTTAATRILTGQMIELGEQAQLALDSMRSDFNGLNDSIGRTIRSVITLVSNIRDAARTVELIDQASRGSKAGGGTGAISLANLVTLAGSLLAVGSILQQIEAQHAQREISEFQSLIAALQGNQEAADAAARAFREAGQGVQSTRNVANAALTLSQQVPGLAGPAASAAINSILQQFGLTLGDLNRIAKDNGIQLLDEKGRIVGNAFAALAEVLGFTIESLTNWGKTLDAQRERLDLRALVQNLPDDPFRNIQNELDLLSGANSPLRGMFDSMDALSREGRERFRATLGHILDIIDQGKIEPFLGNLTSLDDLTSIIRNLATNLNAMDEATESLTESLTNVPTGFRIEAARFNASMPVSSAVGLPAVSAGALNVTFEAGSIVQQPGEDSEAFANRVVASLAGRNRRSATGTPIVPGIH